MLLGERYLTKDADYDHATFAKMQAAVLAIREANGNRPLFEILLDKAEDNDKADTPGEALNGNSQ